MKKEILAHCKQSIDDKAGNLKHQLHELQQSANNASKSSMGDKYETSRAMIHLEQEHLASQQQQLLNQQRSLAQIPTNTHQQAQLGSLVSTNLGVFYLSIGLGAIKVLGESILTVSPNSPIGAKLMGTKKGDRFDFNQRSYSIIDVS